MTERAHCPFCGKNASFSQKTSHVDPQSNTHYDLYECSSCTGQFFEPLKNPGASWYEHDERYAGRNQDPILDAQWNHKAVIAELQPTVGDVLDVGCGVGNFLAHAQSKGWNCWGIDFDKDAIEAGKKTFGLANLFVSDIHEFRRVHSGKQFDLVTFFDVLEHIDDHERFMEAVHSMVKDGGHIAMSMPHSAHAEFLMPTDVPPRHLTRWNEKSLTQFLNSHGFDITYLKPRAEGIRFIILKLRFKYGKKFSMGLVEKVREKAAVEGKPVGRRVLLARTLALIKDTVLFGIPAFFIWLALLPTRKKYVSIVAIAHRRVR